MTSTPSNLQELLAPFPESEFLKAWQARQLTFRRGHGLSPYAEFVGWNALIGLIERGEHPRGLADVRLVKESKNVMADRWLVRSTTENRNRVDLGKVQEYMDQGFNLVITPLEPFVPALAALCESIRDQLSEQTKVGVVVTTGTDGAFKTHYDPEDLIILQVEGKKRWCIYGPPVDDPIIEMPKANPPPEQDPIFDEVLEPGDLLYVPGGNWHHCQNKSDRSVHLGIFMIPPTPWHAMNAVIRHFLTDKRFRKPLTRFENASQLAQAESEIKRDLIANIENLRLADFPRAWTRKRGES